MKLRVIFPLAATFSTSLFQERLLVSVTPGTCWLPRLLEFGHGACGLSGFLEFGSYADHTAFTGI